MRSVVVSMCVFLGMLRIAQPGILAFGQRLAGRPVPVEGKAKPARVRLARNMGWAP